MTFKQFSREFLEFWGAAAALGFLIPFALLAFFSFIFWELPTGFTQEGIWMYVRSVIGGSFALTTVMSFVLWVNGELE